MTQKTKGIPEGFHTVTPYLTLQKAESAIEFYKKAFDAQVLEKHLTEDGRIMNAAIKIGNSIVMLSDEFPEYECGVTPPQALKGTTAMFHLYVEDVDAAFEKAISAGATVKMPVADMFWGDRYGQLQDPFGHIWSIGTPLAKEEMTKDCRSRNSCCC